MTVRTSALDVVALVFAELRALFGSAFTIEHGETPDEYWRAEIAKLTAAELERGLRVVADYPNDPPNCFAFVAACRTGKHVIRRAAHSRAAAAAPSTRDRWLAVIQAELEMHR